MEFKEYYEAIEADAVYHNALVAEYGEAKAGDYRYWPEKNGATPALLAARNASRMANYAWRKRQHESHGNRGGQPCSGCMACPEMPELMQ
jgi:hypothetical protein